MRTAAFLFSVAFLFSGCYMRSKKYWAHEEAKIERCRGDWTYLDLTEKKEFTVILFREKVDFMRIYPAFAIGVTSDHDTIAVMDKNFDLMLQTGQKITVAPGEWTPNEKVEMDPVFSVYPKKKFNDYHCVVKKVYYGKFEL